MFGIYPDGEHTNTAMQGQYFSKSTDHGIEEAGPRPAQQAKVWFEALKPHFELIRSVLSQVQPSISESVMKMAMMQ